MKYLIVGLGNIGDAYKNTRHNIGFDVVDCLAKRWSVEYEAGKLADVAESTYKGRQVTLIKPTTLMNRSGRAVAHWMQQKKVSLDKVLVIVDDLALDLGVLRLRGKGSDGGHNGIANINAILNTPRYARLRFGIGSNFSRGRQVDFVLGKWDKQEEEDVSFGIERAADATESFIFRGLANTMNVFNTKPSS
ncbi:MAG: aminoacyl-tRNA hydrolase [Bacteroidota bacterium]|nr:aminoacyl-tRNA hydrolase [Bacteroidota bacterium]